MYERVKNEDFLKAEERQAQVIGGYRVSEAHKLQSYADRENKRRPENDKDLGTLLSNRMSRIDNQKAGTSRARSPFDQSRASSSEPPKRRKKGPKAYKPTGPSPPPPPPPSSGGKKMGAQPSTSGKGKRSPGQKIKSTKGAPGQYNKKKQPKLPFTKGQPASNEKSFIKMLCKAWLEDSAKSNKWD